MKIPKLARLTPLLMLVILWQENICFRDIAHAVHRVISVRGELHAQWYHRDEDGTEGNWHFVTDPSEEASCYKATIRSIRQSLSRYFHETGED